MTETPMHPIGPIAARLQERLIAARAEAAERRRERLAHYGWDPGCRCADCGDTGTEPERQTICWCPAGERLQQQRVFEQRWSLVVPLRFRDYRLDTAPDRSAARDAAAWIAGEPWREGKSLILTGGTGTGKTGLAVGLMRAAFAAGTVPAIVNVPGWLDDQRPRDGFVSDAGRRAMAEAVRPPLLVLDDLGAERATEWVQERIYCLVNDRYEAMRSTVVTTNAPDLSALAAQVGQRAVSRLAEAATIIPVAGPDRRMSRP